MPYIQWIDEDQAEGELGSLYADWLAANPNRDTVPEIDRWDKYLSVLDQQREPGPIRGNSPRIPALL